jgi:nitronate monooxygenase
MFGLDHPVMSSPMAMHSGGTLAAAVSSAGGLGSFGAMHPTKGPDWVRAQLSAIRAATDRPFAVGFITPFLPFATAVLEAVLAERPPAVALSFADPRPWLDQAKAAGARVLCQVQTNADADTAVEAGADVLVVQGTEAGGHTGTLSLLPFLAAVAARHPDVPLLAAGGIADGRTLAAALVAGADGAWVGTAFLATPEAVEVDDVHKRLIVESDGTDTVLTQAYDIVSGLPWPPTIAERVRRDAFTDEWAGREAELRERATDAAPTSDAVLYGQSAGLVPAIRPAAEVLHTICAQAEAVLRSRPNAILA